MNSELLPNDVYYYIQTSILIVVIESYRGKSINELKPLPDFAIFKRTWHKESEYSSIITVIEIDHNKRNEMDSFLLQKEFKYKEN